MTVESVYKAMNEIAPFSSSMDFDNTGLLIGDPEREVKTVLLCLDATLDVLEEAERVGAELIISHHPIIFSPLRRIQKGDRVYEIVRSGISVISAHTNLDKAFPFGVNHALAEALHLQNIHGVIPDGDEFIGFMGELENEMTPEEFGYKIKDALDIQFLNYVPVKKTIRNVCVVGGSGGEYFADAAKSGADAFVTGEVKHHEAIEAVMRGIALYEAGHYHTEILFREMLKNILEQKCPGIKFLVSEKEQSPMKSM